MNGVDPFDRLPAEVSSGTRGVTVLARDHS
jgi:hypothetical protein